MNIIFNSKFVVQYKLKIIQIYKIEDYKKDMLYLQFINDIVIYDIQFNPVIENILLLSLADGSCKIYDISEQKMEEKIFFEGFDNKQPIEKSKFNDMNTNVIASSNGAKIIIIWDIRSSKDIILVKDEEIIIKFNWNKILPNLLIYHTQKKIKLFDIKNKSIVKTVEKKDINDVIFLNDCSIIIKKNIIEKENYGDEKVENKLENKIIGSNDYYIGDNLLIVYDRVSLFVIDITCLKIIENINFDSNLSHQFIKSNKENEILLYYIEDSEIQKKHITINNKTISKKISDSSNFAKNFYKNYQKKIYKYIFLLDYNENINDNMYIKKYMNIEEIAEFFEKIKEINIFERKEIIDEIFGEKCTKKVMNKCYDLDDFKDIKIFWDTYLNIKETQERKIELIKLMNQNFINDKIIKKFYIEIIKLIIIDNTNEKLIEIYLLFLNIYEIKLNKDNSINNDIEEYKKEVNYYSPLFSKENYKILFEKDKESERDIIKNFLNKVKQIENFLFDNQKLAELCNEAKSLTKNMPDFNQPIELDCKNEELKWHKIKINILYTFSDLELNSDSQLALGRLKNAIRIVMDYQLLSKIDINDKDILECALLLITNPCSVNYKETQFCCNLLSSKVLDKDKLNEFTEKNKSSKLIIDENNKFILIYKNKKYENAENLCLDNLLLNKYNIYKKKEMYNFKYLVNNYVANQDKIRSFLKIILKKNVFKEVYLILFGDNKYKYLDDKYLEEFIDKRLKFVPIRPCDSLAVTDKMSLNTYISIKQREIGKIEGNEIKPIQLEYSENYEESEKSGDFERNEENNVFKESKKKELENEESKHLKEILELIEIFNTGSYVMIEEHEIFHLFDCIPYYENNCSISIRTPRKKNYKEKREGGRYLELLLFNDVLETVNLAQILYVLNESNYDKTLEDFKLGFENLDVKDLIIEGIFKEYSKYIIYDNKKSKSELTNLLINHKKSAKYSIPSIVISLKNDVIGNRDGSNRKEMD